MTGYGAGHRIGVHLASVVDREVFSLLIRRIHPLIHIIIHLLILLHLSERYTHTDHTVCSSCSEVWRIWKHGDCRCVGLSTIVPWPHQWLQNSYRYDGIFYFQNIRFLVELSIFFVNIWVLLYQLKEIISFILLCLVFWFISGHQNSGLGFVKIFSLFFYSAWPQKPLIFSHRAAREGSVEGPPGSPT